MCLKCTCTIKGYTRAAYHCSSLCICSGSRVIILKYYWHDVPVSDTYSRHQGIHQSSLSLFLSVHLLRLRIDHTQISLQAHRSLLQDSGAAAAAKVGNLYNVATVTLEANCSSEQAVPATLTEMQSVMANQLLAVSSKILSTNWTNNFSHPDSMSGR